MDTVMHRDKKRTTNRSPGTGARTAYTQRTSEQLLMVITSILTKQTKYFCIEKYQVLITDQMSSVV